MLQKKYHLTNHQDLESFTTELAAFLQKQALPFYLLLTGDLGAGKTTLTKSLLCKLGVKELVTSPTFVILNQYQGSQTLINHLDAYRLDIDEDLAMYEEAFLNSLNIIEWPERLLLNWHTLPHLKLAIQIINEHEREIKVVK